MRCHYHSAQLCDHSGSRAPQTTFKFQIRQSRAVQYTSCPVHIAANAIDNDPNTLAKSQKFSGWPWLKVYFKRSSTVSKVVIEKGESYNERCIFTVSVYDRETGTVCGVYTGVSG